MVTIVTRLEDVLDPTVVTAESVETQLKDPSVRAIAEAYYEARRSLGEERGIYRQLEQQHPWLKGVLDKYYRRRRGRSIVLYTEDSRNYLNRLDTIAGAMLKMAVTLDIPQNEEDSRKQAPFANALEALANEMVRKIGFCKEMILNGQRHVLGVARAAQAIAAEREGVWPVDIVKSQEGRDEIYRRLFPTRQRFEQYHEFADPRTFNIEVLGLQLLQCAWDTPGIASGWRCDDLTQNVAGISIIEIELHHYKQRDLARIYSATAAAPK